MRAPALPAVLLALAACSGSTSDSGDASAVADVSGQVFLRSGAPLTRGEVTVSCAGGMVTKSSPLGDVGQYGMGLSIHSGALGATSGHVSCTFTADDGTRIVATREKEIGFGPPGLPHVNQLVVLQEQP